MLHYYIFCFLSSMHVLFSTLMENLCGILYETFRPLIIQMTHMETLAELCNILKVCAKNYFYFLS